MSRPTRLSIAGLIAPGFYLVLAIGVYFICSRQAADAGYEYIPFALLELPWGIFFKFNGYQQLLSIPLNMLAIYWALSWFQRRKRRAAVTR